MKERPILFSAPMVRALLDGTKTQTRRLVTGEALSWLVNDKFSPAFVADHGNRLCKYGQPGDRLWVRETWTRDDEDGSFMYRADIGRDMNADAWEQGRLEGVPRYRWRPSIHMPRAASRLTLEVTGVRIERLNEINADDAVKEGIARDRHPEDRVCLWRDYSTGGTTVMQTHSYRTLWESINGPGSWDANPWVWVVGFKPLEA